MCSQIAHVRIGNIVLRTDLWNLHKNDVQIGDTINVYHGVVTSTRNFKILAYQHTVKKPWWRQILNMIYWFI